METEDAIKVFAILEKFYFMFEINLNTTRNHKLKLLEWVVCNAEEHFIVCVLTSYY